MEDRDIPLVESHLDLEERVRQRAHKIWEARSQHGEHATELDDWLQAEREVMGDDGRQPAQDRATVVGPA